MVEQRKKLSVLRYGDEGYEEADRAKPVRGLGLRRSDRSFRPLRKPEVDRGFMGREMRALWKGYMLAYVEQEMETNLIAHGLELSAEARRHMLRVYDEGLEDIFEICYSREDERELGHQLAMEEACELALQGLGDYLGMSFQELNQKLIQIAIRSLRSVNPPGFLDWLLGG